MAESDPVISPTPALLAGTDGGWGSGLRCAEGSDKVHSGPRRRSTWSGVYCPGHYLLGLRAHHGAWLGALHGARWPLSHSGSGLCVLFRALPSARSVSTHQGPPGPAAAGRSPFSRSPELLTHAYSPRVDTGPSSAHAGAPGRAVVRFVSAPSGEGTCSWPHSWPSTHPNSRCSAASLTLSRCPWWPPARAPVLREPFGSTPGSVHVGLF